MENAPGAARELQSGTSVLMEQLSAYAPWPTRRLARSHLRAGQISRTSPHVHALAHAPLHASQPVTFDLTRAVCVPKGGTLSYVTKAAIEATWQLEWERFSTHGAERGLLAESRRAGLYQW